MLETVLHVSPLVYKALLIRLEGNKYPLTLVTRVAGRGNNFPLTCGPEWLDLALLEGLHHRHKHCH